MPPGTKYVHTIQRNWPMIKKKQLSGHILFDDSIKSPQAIRRYFDIDGTLIVGQVFEVVEFDKNWEGGR
jgi:hypothetical protein